MKRKYIVVDIADRWYEEGVGIVFDNFQDTLNFLRVNQLDCLIDKLNYLEKETSLDECVISYL